MEQEEEVKGFNLTALEEKRQHFKALREKIAQNPLKPFSFLEITPKPLQKEALKTANFILKNGWSMGNSPIISVTSPVPWVIEPRSFACHLHAWIPIQRLLLAFDYDPSQTHYFDAAFSMAVDWIKACPIQLTSLSLEESIQNVLKTYTEHYWWYDMSIAQRLNYLSYLVDICCRDEKIPDTIVFSMMNHILLHHALLDLPIFYKHHNNHGFFQALHQYASLQRLPELDIHGFFMDQSYDRLNHMIEQQYTSEMMHREHSPGYHYMVTTALMNAQKAQLFDLSPDLQEKLLKAKKNLTHMVMPSGNLSPFGDTDPRNLLQEEGLIGEEPLQGVGFFPQSGYAFARFAHTTKDMNTTAYLAQASCFHSRTHKHADHLTFVWCDYGRDILTDAGRYAYAGKTQKGDPLFEEGFWYSDPKRIYCESTRAHNCVVIDGKNYPRKGVKPFGSALVEAYEDHGLFITYSDVRHFQTIRHQRRLVMKPGHFLIVLDWLYDRTETPHDYTQRFLLDAPWQAVRKEGMIKATHTGSLQESTETLPPLSLCVGTFFDDATVLDGTRGEESPALLGWMSDKPNSLIPACSLGIQATSHGPHGFATLFTFSESLILHLSTKNTTLTKGSLAWTDDRGTHTLSFHKKEEKVSFSLKSV